MKIIVRNGALMRAGGSGRSSMPDEDVLNVNQLRERQDQRVALALDSWKKAKEHLEEAIRLVEVREKEFHAVSEDVRRKLAALEVVVAMAGDREPAPETLQLSAHPEQPLLTAPEKAAETSKATAIVPVPPELPGPATDLRRLDGVLGASSRPLFSRRERAGFAALSILQ
jgi:hypothetical protein